jgi:LysM repeat protein
MKYLEDKMKSLVYALAAIAILAGLLFSPFSASTAAAQSTCGDKYTVQVGDYLSKIASKCNVPLNTIIQANPEIKDINKIYPGQVIRLKVDNTIPVTGGTSGTYTVVKGDTLGSIAKRYGTTTTEILKVNPQITNPSLIYPGQVIYLPSGTTSTSSQVTLSTTSAKPGAQIDVKVTGFPANTDIDFRLGKDGQTYSVVADGKTDASGYATVKMTIPTSAVVNEKWVVKVLTTSVKNGIERSSPLITITN